MCKVLGKGYHHRQVTLPSNDLGLAVVLTHGDLGWNSSHVRNSSQGFVAFGTAAELGEPLQVLHHAFLRRPDVRNKGGFISATPVRKFG